MENFGKIMSKKFFNLIKLLYHCEVKNNFFSQR